jgi:4'-phosphopantetheinyl transferase
MHEDEQVEQQQHFQRDKNDFQKGHMFTNHPFWARQYNNHLPRGNVRIRAIELEKVLPSSSQPTKMTAAPIAQMVSKPSHTTATDSRTAFPPENVEVWTIDLSVPAPFIRSLMDFLPAEEHRQAERFRNPAAQRSYVLAHAALRQLLAARLNVAPAEISLRTGHHGKPELSAPLENRLSFNLTHSGELALVAISNSTEVGVDVERLRPLPDAGRLATRFFTPAESAALDQVPEAERASAFFRLWTRKEALLKATGIGIAQGLGRFEVSCDVAGRLISVDGDPAGAAQWTLHSWRPAEGYQAAVAAPRPDTQFQFGQHQWRHD